MFNITFTHMISRRLTKKLIKVLSRSSSIALMGPRQVGKTTLAKILSAEFSSVYLDLENRLDLERVRDITAFHSENRDKLIILDEIQRMPEIFSTLRGIIDGERQKGNKTGHFLFLGSASLDLLRQSSESLAGRISYLELHPVDVLEYGSQNPSQINRLWLRGGFPESLLANSDGESLRWRYDFVKTYLERDIPQIGPRIPAETLERFWVMLAHNQGGVFNAAQMARNLDASGVTVARYLDLMVDLLLVRRLRPWTFNIGKRLIKAPKVYVRDSGIAHSLLNISNYNDLLGHPVVGGSWEGFVIENLLSVLDQRIQPFYYRTAGGAEIDLVLEFGVNDLWALEIKRSSSPSLSKGFHQACDDLQPTRKYVVYSGDQSFPMKNDVTAISLANLMQVLQEEFK